MPTEVLNDPLPEDYRGGYGAIGGGAGPEDDPRAT